MKRCTVSRITESDSTCAITTSSSAFFSGCTAPKSLRGRVSALRLCNASWCVIAGGYGPKASPGAAPPSTSRCQGMRMTMDDVQQVEILLVEDNPNDAGLTMRSLKKGNFLNKLYWVKDGQQALDFLYCTGDYAGRDGDDHPRLILLDLKMPKVDGIEVLQRIKSDERLRVI